MTVIKTAVLFHDNSSFAPHENGSQQQKEK